MAIFKCKICGGSLEIEPAQSIATCEYCGTKQTLPKLSDERRANLYDRAGHFRRNNDFDKAIGIFEEILKEDPADAEAYWSLVLCHYGIEYVKDPTTGRRMPTVNRAQYTSIFDNEDYKSALRHADSASHALYEAEAEAINEIQRGILAISQREEPFDVFICYKESDQNGRRTRDSVIAAELYQELTREGFKVFFSRITLEDKLGVAYEPYIFAALNSAKVMVVLGTDAAHFNAVWVKNEWSRYLALIKNGARKILIPAYRDMDPYDLPEEFSHLQAQDMSRLGFMQDLVRGVKKIVGAGAQKTAPAAAPVVTEPAVNVNALLRRASLSLEDGAFEEADDFCEQVLNQDPENGTAYLYKLMAELEVRTPEALANHTAQFEQSSNYHRALRFGNSKLKFELEGYATAATTKQENELLDKAQRALAAASHKIPKEGLRDVRDLIQFLQPLQHRPEGISLLRDCQETEQRLLHEIERQEDEALKWQLERSMQSINEAEKPIYALDDAKELLERLKANADKTFAAEMIPACEAKIAELEVLVEAERKAISKQIALKRKKARRNTIIIFAILGALLLFGILYSAIRYAVTHENANGVEYIKENDGYHVLNVDSNLSGDVVIPAEIDGIPVTAIKEEAFKDCTKITGITVPNSVTRIGCGAFQGCDNLAALSLPFIGEAAQNASSTRLTYIFGASESSLSDASIPHTLKSVTVTGSCVIDDYAFYDCSSLSSIILGDSVTSIGASAFANCIGLSEITVPNSVTSIGFSAFSGCSSLESISLPFVGATSLGNRNTYFGYIFGASNPSEQRPFIPQPLKHVAITDSTTIDYAAFLNCNTLISVTLSNGITKIGELAFGGCPNLSSITIPESVTSIGKDAFSNSALTEIVIPENVTSIGSFAFAYCDKLTTITIPHTITTIEEYTFCGCSSLSSITIPASITSIADNAFANCSALSTITIPTSVTSIGDYAFAGCDKLTSVIIPASVTSIGRNPFAHCDNIEKITVEDDNKFYHSAGNCLIETASKNLITGCHNSSIPTDGNVISIGDYAFASCKLTSITIPASVTSIGSFAFANCDRLVSVIFTNKTAWKVSRTADFSGYTVIFMSTAASNATQLKSTYVGHYWKSN